jgi:hypothetical protein
MPFAPLLLAPVAISAAIPAVAPARTVQAPAIDGRLDDDAWRAAPVFSAFVQKFPAERSAPAEPTTVRVVYDDAAVYLAIDCVQARAPITARLTRRDRVIEADRVAVYLDTMLDHKSAYHFEVNAAGVQVDGLHYGDTEVSYDWDDVWQAAVARRAGGWSAELMIPLRLLRFRGDPDQTWGFQVRRYVAATQEIDELAYVPRDAGGEVSRFGQLGPLHQLRKPLGVELRPFAALRLGHRDATDDTLERGFDAGGDLGVDGKWRLAQAATLDFTVNPDFGQVEADQVVLNLTSYETFFPDKRPFFLEGLDLFATPVNVLYTRRIGSVPTTPELLAGEVLEAAPGPARIDGAGKLTGRAGPTSFAVLSALTDETTVTARGADGQTRTVVAAPYTFFNAARFKLDVGERAALGLIGTSATRLGDERDSLVGGLDVAWRSPGGDWAARGQALASSIHDGEPRQFPDGSLVRPGDSSGAAVVSLAKEGGHLVGELDCDLTGRHFDPNDVGYLERQDVAHCFASTGWHDTAAGRLLVELQHNLEIFYRYNLRGQDLGSGYQLNTSGQLENAWRYFTELHWRPAHLDDRELGDGTALERAGLVGWELSVHSDRRRAVIASAASTIQWLSNGLNVEAEAAATFRLHPQLDLELAPTALWTTGEPRFIADDGTTRLFGRLHALALGATVRAIYTFTPALTLQGYAQLFVDRVRFSDFSSAPAGDQVIELGDLMPAPTPAESPDFVDGALNATVVLRWEFRPGSTFFLVYSRAQDHAAATGTDDTPGLPALSTLRAPAADVILAKLSWWFG